MQDLTKLPMWRSKPYREWVATLPSVESGIINTLEDDRGGNDPNHAKGLPDSIGGDPKPSDIFVFPLTHYEHVMYHQHGWRLWETANNLNQKDCILQTLDLAFRSGLFKFDG